MYNNHEEVLFVSGSADQTLKIWKMHRDYSSNRRRAYKTICMRTLFGHKSSITNLLVPSTSSSLSPPFDELVSCSSDGEIRVWCVSRGTCLTSVQGRARNISNLLFAWRTTNEMVGASCSLNESLISVWSLTNLSNSNNTSYNASFANGTTNTTNLATTAANSIEKRSKDEDFDITCVKTFRGHTREVKCLTFLNELTV
jgi:WD40 repeat protein